MAKLVQRKDESVDSLIKAGLRQNSVRALSNAIEHYEEKFLGQLPASVSAIEDYILFSVKAGYAMTTISQRLALLGMWHRSMGYDDPTKDDNVKLMMRGARKKYSVKSKQAEPLTKLQIQSAVQACDDEIASAATIEDKRLSRAKALKAIRDKAFILVGFWFAFRSDELINLEFEHISFGIREDVKAKADVRSMSIFLPSSKGDKESLGQEWTINEMSVLCPVNAMLDWKAARMVDEGPVFVKIDRWGRPNVDPMHINSVVKMMRSTLARAGLEADKYSSHSMRRGFANYAAGHKTNSRELMKWVKWKDIRSAIRYTDDSSDLANELASKDSIAEKHQLAIEKIK